MHCWRSRSLLLALRPMIRRGGGRTWFSALAGSLTKHKRCFRPAAALTFTCQSDFLRHPESMGGRLQVSAGSAQRASSSSVCRYSSVGKNLAFTAVCCKSVSIQCLYFRVEHEKLERIGHSFVILSGDIYIYISSGVLSAF